MHKIDGAGHSSNTFTEGDPQVPTPATVVTDDWLNAVQAEIVEVIEHASLTLSKPDNTQLRQAINILVSLGAIDTGRFQYATSSTVKLAKGYKDTLRLEVNGNILSQAGDLTFDLTSDLDTGSEQADTWYYCYVDDVAGVMTPVISATGPEVSANKIGYHPSRTDERYVGAFRNNGSSNILPFDVVGQELWLRQSTEFIYSLGTVVPTAWSSQALTMPKTANLVYLDALIKGDDAAIAYGRSGTTVALPATQAAHKYGDSGMDDVLFMLGGDQGGSGEGHNAARFAIPIGDQASPAVSWGILNIGASATLSVNDIVVIGYKDELMVG